MTSQDIHIEIVCLLALEAQADVNKATTCIGVSSLHRSRERSY